MTKRLIFTTISLFIITACFSQEFTLNELKKYTDSLITLSKTTLEIPANSEDYLSKYDTIAYAKELGLAYHELGKLYYKNKNLKKAIVITKNALSHKRKVADNSYEINKSLNNLYYFYDNVRDKKAVLEQIINNKSYDKYTFRAYNLLGKVYIEVGDYYKALQCYNYVIKSYKKHHNKTNLYVYAHIGSIHAYSNLKINSNHLKTIAYHNNEIEKNKENINKKKLAYNHNNLAVIHRKLEYYEKSISLYKKALDFFMQTNNQLEINNLYNNIGEAYSELKNTQEGAKYFDKALYKTKDSVLLNYVYHNKGYYLETDNSLKKIPYYQKAIKSVLGNKYNYTTLNELPLIVDIKTSEYSIDILEDLIQIANTWVLVYKEKKNIAYLKNAKNTIYLIDELISYIRFESSIDQSKLFWINKGVDTYMLGVEVAYLLNDVESAFYFMEKNKALLLLESLNNKPTETLSITTLDTAKKKHVSKTSNFIEYSLNENQGYGIFCSDNETIFFEIENISEFLKEIKRLKTQYYSPFTTKKDEQYYIKNANLVFKKLFPFEDALQKISNKKLTVVSDYKIKNIAFDALTTNTSNKNIKESYLINNTEISYLYSASVYNQLQKKEYKPKYNVLAIAPETFAIDSLTALEKSSDDVAKMASLFPTRVLKNQDATKKDVLLALNDYNIIHFNTHAGLDKLTQEPWIALYDQKINLQELYKQPIQANLVVLDACKSASGKIELGEGVMSLSRAFTHNGAKSVIASQWNANEASVNSIFNTFYKELKKGASKSKALRKAKLNYLDSNQLSKISPYYWASMTLTGDTKSIQTSKMPYAWIVLIILTIIIISSYLLYTKKTNR